MRSLACLAADLPTRVSELIDATTASWDREKIQKFLVKVDADLILGLPICTRNIKDFGPGILRNEAFSLRSAYRMLVETKMRRDVKKTNFWLYIGAT
jgi:hypothetical protein